jgi:xylose isomerase
MTGIFKFTFGPWNIHEGADPFGPTVRESIEFSKKLEYYKKLGFEGVQFHDDDAVPDMNDLSPQQITSKANEVRKVLTGKGLVAEFVAPRLWEDPRTIDGGYTSNDPDCRKYALERSKRSIDSANALGTDLIVLWLAREGTYIRESKDSMVATERIFEAINLMLAWDPKIRICIEPKPNEPMDHCSFPPPGHIALLSFCAAILNVGHIESAYATG